MTEKLNAGHVHAAIVAAVGDDVIVGMSMGKADDPETWEIQFVDGATAEQRVAAQAAMEAFAVEALGSDPD